MRATLVHNPSAGDRRHSPKRILRELAEAGYDARVAPREKGFRKAMEDPGDLVVVAGGDGSIKQVALALLGRSTPMAILPIGTANNIAKSLRIKGSVGELIAGWKQGQRLRLTVGTVSAPFGTMRFVESVGAGVFTELVVRGEEEVKHNTGGLTGHTLDRGLQLLHGIVLDRKPSPRALLVDGEDLSGDYLLVEVMNTSMVGPNVPLAPDANFQDDQLDVVTVTEKERGLLAEYLEARLAGGAQVPRLTVRRGQRVTMRASARELHVDDAPWHPDQSDDARTARAGRDEGDVNVTLGTGVEVLVGPPTPAKA
jgi:diacylglycerol kinase family enzyme